MWGLWEWHYLFLVPYIHRDINTTKSGRARHHQKVIFWSSSAEKYINNKINDRFSLFQVHNIFPTCIGNAYASYRLEDHNVLLARRHRRTSMPLVVDLCLTEDENSTENILIPMYKTFWHSDHEILGTRFSSRSRTIHCNQRANVFLFPWWIYFWSGAVGFPSGCAPKQKSITQDADTEASFHNNQNTYDGQRRCPSSLWKRRGMKNIDVCTKGCAAKCHYSA